MIRSPRFLCGVALGVAGVYLLSRPPAPRAFVGGVSYQPKRLRREGRLLGDKQAAWSFLGGSSR